MTRLTKVCAAVVALACAVPARTVRATAPAGRYTTSNGTVLDTKTKLTWQQPPALSAMAWSAAKSYCAGIGATLGGSGWRLPTIKELQTLVDVSVTSGPTIDATYFPNTTTGTYWSSTPVSATPSFVWVVGFSNGGDGQIGVDQMVRARCVR